VRHKYVQSIKRVQDILNRRSEYQLHVLMLFDTGLKTAKRTYIS